MFQIRPVVVGSVDCERNIPVSDNHDLRTEDAARLQAILQRMPLSKEGTLSKTYLITHRIETGDAIPMKQVRGRHQW